MAGVWTLWACLSLAPEPAPPPPALDPNAPSELEAEPEGPQEGPAPPKGELGPEAAGIDWAVPPPEDEGAKTSEDEEDTQAQDEPTPLPEPSWPDPGNAPGDGMGLFVGGAVLLPTAALATWAIAEGQGSGPVERGDPRIATIVTGAGMGLIALGFFGLGTYRQLKLQRWEVAYRVRATPQGGGMLSGGALAANLGAVLTATSIYALARQVSGPWPPTLLAVGLATVGIAAPVLIVFGKRRRDRYVLTGGWYRPAMPELRPQALITPTSFGVGVRGRF